jgi:hypothetical protein
VQRRVELAVGKQLVGDDRVEAPVFERAATTVQAAHLDLGRTLAAAQLREQPLQVGPP